MGLPHARIRRWMPRASNRIQGQVLGSIAAVLDLYAMPGRSDFVAAGAFS